MRSRSLAHIPRIPRVPFTPHVSQRLHNESSDIWFVLTFATLWSWMEVEIEGPTGWAMNLPTSCAFFGWTWYHMSMNCIILLVLHRSLWSLHYERGVLKLARFVIYTALWYVVEDFMWFALNPHFGLIKYNKTGIPWHTNKVWVMGTFIENWIVLTVWLVAVALEYRVRQSSYLFKDLTIALGFIGMACVCSFSYPGYYSSRVVVNEGCHF